MTCGYEAEDFGKASTGHNAMHMCSNPEFGT